LRSDSESGIIRASDHPIIGKAIMKNRFAYALVALFALGRPGSCPAAPFAEDSPKPSWRVTLGQLNDNIPIPYSWAIPGWSIGPDDQYTCQSVLHARYGAWGFDVDDTVVTSRLYDYRFDILRVAASCAFSFPGGALRPSLGFALGGNYSGAAMQNAWHRYVVIYPELDIPYIDLGAALYLGLDADYAILSLPSVGLALGGYADIELYTGVGASSLTSGFELTFEGTRFEADAIAGVDCHAFLPDALAPLLENGLAAAGLFTWKPSRIFNMSLGIGVFPVGDVTDDPAFLPREYPVTAQIFYLFTLGEKAPRIREFVLP
jgi:hypothetical protein